MLSVAQEDILNYDEQILYSHKESENILNHSFKEIIIIDSNVEDYNKFLEHLFNKEIFLINSNADGLEQINQILTNLGEKIDSLHIISHSADNKLLLGNSEISYDNLNQFESSFKLLGSHLSSSGDIFFYGCNLAKSYFGKQLVSKISNFTSADVKASDDLTGSSHLGGDFNLEFDLWTIEGSAVYDDLQNYKLNKIIIFFQTFF